MAFSYLVPIDFDELRGFKIVPYELYENNISLVDVHKRSVAE